MKITMTSTFNSNTPTPRCSKSGFLMKHHLTTKCWWQHFEYEDLIFRLSQAVDDEATSLHSISQAVDDEATSLHSLSIQYHKHITSLWIPTTNTPVGLVFSQYLSHRYCDYDVVAPFSFYAAIEFNGQPIFPMLFIQS